MRMDTTEILTIIEEEIEKLATGFEEDRDSEEYKAAVLVLTAATLSCSSVEFLIDITGYEKDFVEAVATRLTNSGIWEDEFVHSLIFVGDKISVVGFICDSLVASGRFVARREPNGKFRYWLREYIQ